MKLTMDDIREMYKMDESKPRSRWAQWIGEAIGFLIAGTALLLVLWLFLLILQAILSI